MLSKIEKEFDYKKEVFASKQDLSALEVRLSRTIYIVSVAQFLAIIGSVLAIVKLIHG
jgi:hypothetical protein